jgi:hypothetical protein
VSEPKATIGQAIDQIIQSLRALEKREQQAAVAMVCTLLDLAPAQTSAPPPPAQRPAEHVKEPPDALGARSDTDRGPAPPLHGLDIRTLRDEKQPESARQMACVVAYYLMEHAPEAERKQSIVTADLDRYFKQAKFKLPTKLDQVLPDCKTAGYFEQVSRGEYRLTRVGYNLVTHSLPKTSKV